MFIYKNNKFREMQKLLQGVVEIERGDHDCIFISVRDTRRYNKNFRI